MNEPEHDETCCMNGVPLTAGPHPDCPGIAAPVPVVAGVPGTQDKNSNEEA